MINTILFLKISFNIGNKNEAYENMGSGTGIGTFTLNFEEIERELYIMKTPLKRNTSDHTRKMKIK